jgi:hypothetical protein
MLETFAKHLNLTTVEVESLLSLSLADFLAAPEVKQLLATLDVNFLRETLPTAGTVLAKQLPPFYDWLKNELGVARVPDSPDHTTKWVVGFLDDRESLTRLVELHRPVPRMAVEKAIPRLVAAFNGVEDAQTRQTWQTAVTALCLPLVVDARERQTTTMVQPPIKTGAHEAKSA